MSAGVSSNRAFFNQLKKYYTWYTGGFITFVIVLAILEQMGLPKVWIGYVFLFATIALYAGIGIMSRTADVAEYYVAGRRVPALFNGMATGADWMSAASFIGMAGTLYLSGFDGLGFVIGWTGGYVLVALFLAPYLRKFGQFTIPDFLGARYGGNIPRAIGVFAAILCSFTYVVAQIYGVGIITSRFTGVEFGVGVFLGLAGILVCSFLGGMRAVTWTQVAQYIILIVAYMIPVVWLSVKITGHPDSAARLRWSSRASHGAGEEADGGSEGAGGPQDLRRARSGREEAHRGTARHLGGRQGGCGPEGPGPEGRQRRDSRDPRRRKGTGGLSAVGRRRAQGLDATDRLQRGALGPTAAARDALSDQQDGRGRREGARYQAQQLPCADVLHDVRYRSFAAHPDAVLHDAVGAGSARFGVLVAVLHLPALLHGPRACGAREVRGLQQCRRHIVRQSSCVGGGLGEDRSDR